MLRETFKQRVRIAPAYTSPSGRSSPNARPQAPGQNHQLQWIKTAAYRKQHPCYHIDFTKWKKKAGCGCACGSVYGCEVYDECAITHNQSCQVRSCVFCPSYVETVELRAAPMSLIIPVGITTCPIIRCAKKKNATCDLRSCQCGGVGVGYRHTLPKTLGSIVSAGWDRSDVTIFAEPESRPDPSVMEAINHGWGTIFNEKRLQPWGNLFSGLRQQRMRYPDADSYLMMEDDTWLSHSAKTELERRGLPPDPNWGIVRMFRMSGRGHPWRQSDTFCDAKRTDGYQRVRAGEYLWGTNAVLFSPAAIGKMMADKIDDSHQDSPDLKIGKLMIQYGLSEWCCNPSLAQTDTSKPSVVGHGTSKGMESDTFVQDALEVGVMYV